MSQDPIEFEEGGLLLRFPANAWQVLKWDDDELFCERIAKLNGELSDTAKGTTIPEGTKAVDFVALHPSHGLYLIELKDFRGHAAANKHRHERELPLEIGLKVRDTIAGLVGACRVGAGNARVAPFASALVDRELPLQVVAWIAEDGAHPRQQKTRQARDQMRLTALRRSLAWLTRKVWVDDPLALAVELDGVSVIPQP